MIKIKDIKNKKIYENIIFKQLFSYLDEGIFKPLFEIMNYNPAKAQNDYNPITEALKSGSVIYTDEGFKAKYKFTNTQAKEFERWGAKYNKWTKTYQIPYNNIPNNVLVALSENQIKQQAQITAVQNFIKELDANLPYMIDTMLFDTQVETILDDAGNTLKQNTKKLNVIVPELNKSQKQAIARDYTNNMRFWIKEWASEHLIPEMRQRVQEAVLAGYRADYVQKMLEKEFGIAKRKAKFLARNETAIMLAEYRKTEYQKIGINHFIWSTTMDGRERELHKELNGKVFRFDNPPVIEQIKVGDHYIPKPGGRRGLPGEIYNCRCHIIPYIPNSPI